MQLHASGLAGMAGHPPWAWRAPHHNHLHNHRRNRRHSHRPTRLDRIFRMPSPSSHSAVQGTTERCRVNNTMASGHCGRRFRPSQHITSEDLPRGSHNPILCCEKQKPTIKQFAITSLHWWSRKTAAAQGSRTRLICEPVFPPSKPFDPVHTAAKAHRARLFLTSIAG